MTDRLNHYVTRYYLRAWCREPEREVMGAFPLTPRKLFVATRPENSHRIKHADPAMIAKLSNKSQCQGAIRWV